MPAFVAADLFYRLLLYPDSRLVRLVFHFAPHSFRTFHSSQQERQFGGAAVACCELYPFKIIKFQGLIGGGQKNDHRNHLNSYKKQDLFI